MMRCKKILILVLLCLVLLPVKQVVAQGSPPHRRDRPMPPEERERIRENIETLRMWKLLEALDLSSEQSTQFLPALKDFQNAKRRFQDKRRELLGELETALESEDENEKKLKETLDALEDVRRGFQLEFEAFLEKAKATLSLEQQAKFHLFEEKFEERLRKSIREIRGGGPHWKESE